MKDWKWMYFWRKYRMKATYLNWLSRKSIRSWVIMSKNNLYKNYWKNFETIIHKTIKKTNITIQYTKKNQTGKESDIL